MLSVQGAIKYEKTPGKMMFDGLDSGSVAIYN